MSISTRRLYRAKKSPTGGETLTAMATYEGNGSATLHWTASFTPVNWIASRDGTDRDGTGPWTSSPLPASQHSLTFTALREGDTYTLTVTGGGKTATATITIPLPTSNVISNFVVAATTTSSISLSWSYNGAALSNYTLSRNGSSVATPAAATTSFVDSGLASGTSYTYTLVGNLAAGGTTNTASTQGSTVAVSTGGSPAWPLKVSANKRYLVDSANAPFYVAADTGWLITSKLTLAETRYYLDGRKAKGFNAICISLVDHSSGGVQPTTTRSGQKLFLNNTIAQPNPAFFDYFDSVVSEAASRDMLLMVWPMWLQMAYGGSSSDPTFTAANVQAYGNYLGARYKNSGNIVWVMGGDCGGPYDGGDFPAQSVIRALANAIKSQDANHLMSYHPGVNLSSSLGYNGDSWLDFHGTYWDFNTNNMSSAYKNIYRDYDTSPARPTIMLESGYEGPHPGDANPYILTAKTSRIQSYYMSLAGGLGFTYGANSTYDMSRTDPRTWQQTLEIPGAYHQGYVAKVFQAHNWWTLAPSRAGDFLTSGGGSYGGTDYATAALAYDGRLGMIYMPTRRTITINMSKMTASTVTARWYDPTSGTYSTAGSGTYTNSGSQNFTPPTSNSAGDNDWLLVVVAV